MGASAHSDVAPTPDTIWYAWEPDPLIAIGLILMSWLYLRGTGELWRRAGTGRGVQRWNVWAFYGGVAMFAAATLTPLDALGGALFSGHMVQHLALFLVAPMLFAVSRPMLPMLWALPATWRWAVVRWWTSHVTATSTWRVANHWIAVLMLYGGVLWIWHVPSLYDGALGSQVTHAVEHVSFAVIAFLFWTVVVDAGRPEGVGHGVALLMVFVTALHSSALGSLLTFADTALYASHTATTEAWGLTPLEDQQLAGVLMWVPMGLWFTLVAISLVASWISAAGRSVQRLESGSATDSRSGAAYLAFDPPAAPGRD